MDRYCEQAFILRRFIFICPCVQALVSPTSLTNYLDILSVVLDFVVVSTFPNSRDGLILKKGKLSS